MPGPPLASEIAAFAVERTGRARVTLRGASMLPTLHAGMVAEVERLDAAPRRGDILVFRGPTGLVAHRLVAQRGDAFITCGDALPSRLETVDRNHVIGRVVALWSGDGPQAVRLDARLSRSRGRRLLASRRRRAVLGYARERLSFFRKPSSWNAQPAAFRQLVAASFAFEGGDPQRAVAALTTVPLDALVATALRHQLGGTVSRWLENAAAAGVDVPATLREPFTRLRFESALQAGKVTQRVRDVARRLQAVGIDAIVLKGGARLARGDVDAQLHYAGDVDVLVARADIERATATLLAAGYRQEFPPDRIAFFAARHHHIAPLIMPGERVAVELHVALATPGSVSENLDYARFFPHSEIVEGPAGSVRVLDRVHSALHLAYHARDLQVWRDIVLLSRLLRAMTTQQRANFDAHANAERRDRVRLRAAIAAADAIRDARLELGSAVRGYLAWSVDREDFPELFRRRAHIIEALVARSPRHFSGWRESLRQSKGWLYNLALTPSILRYWRWSVRSRGSSMAAFGLGSKQRPHR